MYSRISPVSTFRTTTLMRFRSLENAFTRSIAQVSSLPRGSRRRTAVSSLARMKPPSCLKPWSSASSSGLPEFGPFWVIVLELQSSTQRAISSHRS